MRWLMPDYYYYCFKYFDKWEVLEKIDINFFIVGT